MRKYAHSVCAICICCGIIFTIFGIYGIIQIASPGFGMGEYKWQKIATFQSFKTDWEKDKETPELTDEELKVRWQDKREIAIMGEKRQGKQNLTRMFICFIIVIPLFVIHWRLARKAKEE